MNWQKVTIEQYQEVYRLLKDTGMDSFEKETLILAALSGKTTRQIEALTIADYKKLRQEVDFAFSAPPKGKPSQYIKANGRWYKVIYDIRKIRANQYVTLQHFAKSDIIENLHQVLACTVAPARRIAGFFVAGRYNASNHERYAEDLKQCAFIHAHNSALFFWTLFNNAIAECLPFLEDKAKEALKSRSNPSLTHSSEPTDGWPMSQGWPSMSG